MRMELGGIFMGIPGISVLDVTSHSSSLPAASTGAAFITPNNTIPNINFLMLLPPSSG